MQYDEDGFDSSWDDLADLPNVSGLSVADFNAAGAEFDEANAAKLGSGARFKALVAKLRAQGVKDPEALAAKIGRKKFGKGKFQGIAAAAAKKKGSRSLDTPVREMRMAPLTLDRDAHGFTAKLVSYGPADSFRTRWAPGVFDESVQGHFPVLAWGHNWADPIGRMDDYADGPDAPRGHFRLDDGDYVPRAKQALYQLRSGTLTDVSVGILRRSDEPNDDGTTTITRADLDEVSLVLRGAVPGAQVDPLTVRSAGGMTFDDVVALATRVQSGQITRDAALATIDLMSGPVPMTSTGVIEGAASTDTRQRDAEVRQALLESDLAMFDRRYR